MIFSSRFLLKSNKDQVKIVVTFIGISFNESWLLFWTIRPKWTDHLDQMKDNFSLFKEWK